MKTFFRTIIGSVVLLTPSFVLAYHNGIDHSNQGSNQGAPDFDEFTDTANVIIGFINDTLIPLVFAIALLVFIWGMFRFFILGAHKDDDRAAGKQLMIWATVGFVLMVSIFGIVNLVAGGLGFSGDQIQNLPDAPTSRN